VPPFRLKIETAFHGDTRCALMPEGFHEFPGAVRGVARLLKLYPDNRPPYTSVIHLDGLSLGDMVNGVLRSSFQSGSVILVSRDADQSAMLHRLPPVGRHGDRDDDPVAAVERFRRSIEAPLAKLFARALTGREELHAAFEALGFHPLASRPVRLRCGCSRDRMLRNLRLVADGDAGLDELFGAGRPSLEVTCDYCKTRYRVTRDDLGAPGSALH
jgi:redox-regulated HSP33 family molecular chaperone